MKTTLYEDEDVLFQYEAMGDDLVLHCEVSHWSTSRYKKMLKVFGQFLNEKDRRVLTVTPNPQFAKLFGGRKTNSFEYEGIYYEVVMWD